MQVGPCLHVVDEAAGLRERIVDLILGDGETFDASCDAAHHTALQIGSW